MRAQIVDYTNYKSALPNGVVRLSEVSPSDIDGLLTTKLRVCFAIIMHNNDRISLMHFHTKTTDFSSIKTELDWLSERGGSIVVNLVRNDGFYRENPQHIINGDSDYEEIIDLLTQDNVEIIIKHSADSGAVLIERDTKNIVILPGRVEDYDAYEFMGEAGPDPRIRGIIADFAHKSRVPANIEYDGNKWHKNYDLSTTIYTGKDIAIFKNIVVRSFPNIANSLSPIEFAIDALPLMQELKSRPGNFVSEYEYQGYLKNQTGFILSYIQEHLQDLCQYKLFGLNQIQEDLIDSIGGSVLPDKDRGMFVIEVNTKSLTKDVRDVLNIERVRVTKISFEDFEKYITPELNGKIMGWRGQVDPEKENSILVTFPYHNEADKNNSISVLNRAIENKNIQLF